MINFGRVWERLGFIDVLAIQFVFGWTLVCCSKLLVDRKFGQSLFLGICAFVMSGAFWLWWKEWQGLRWLMVLLPIVIIYFWLAEKPWKSEVFRRIATIITSLVLLDYGTAPLMMRLPVLGMETSDSMIVPNPNGSYTAVIENKDGLTFGYDRLALRPNHFALSTLIDWPQVYVAEFVTEQKVNSKRWNSPTDLTLMIDPSEDVVYKHVTWRGVRIHYLTDQVNGFRKN